MSDAKTIYVRAPEELHARLTRWAKKKGLSGNAAVLVLLDKALIEEEKPNGHTRLRRKRSDD